MVKKTIASRLLDVRGAAELLGRSEGAVRKLIARREIPYRRQGTRIILFEHELRDWLNALPGLLPEDIQAGASLRRWQDDNDESGDVGGAK